MGSPSVSTATSGGAASRGGAGSGAGGAEARRLSLLHFVVRSLLQRSPGVGALPAQLEGLRAAAGVQVRPCCVLVTSFGATQRAGLRGARAKQSHVWRLCACVSVWCVPQVGSISALVAELQAGYQLLAAEAAHAATLLAALEPSSSSPSSCPMAAAEDAGAEEEEEEAPEAWAAAVALGPCPETRVSLASLLGVVQAFLRQWEERVRVGLPQLEQQVIMRACVGGRVGKEVANGVCTRVVCLSEVPRAAVTHAGAGGAARAGGLLWRGVGRARP